jgi:predicted nucleic acid-binding protein
MNAIDTNVWVYLHDTRDPRKQAIAQQLIAETRPIALPWQVGCEFVAASRKLAVVGFTETQAWAALAAMRDLADAILCPFPTSGRKRKCCKAAIPFHSGTHFWGPAVFVAASRFSIRRTWVRHGPLTDCL